MAVTPTITPQAERYLEALAAELEITADRYEQAERSYQSLAKWLHRNESVLKVYDPVVYVQGSFRLGTAIRPLNEQEEYDVDSVCELRRLSKGQLSQAHLKALLGEEVAAYRRAQNMKKAITESRRCWVLHYADGAQFHMDVLPALPNGIEQRLLLERYGHDASLAESAIAITDNEARNYEIVSNDWPRSNPKGYSTWFRSKMRVMFERRRRELAESISARIEDIPDYRVRTPLQSAVMILKRHRDFMFDTDDETRPISIILTTLSAHAYGGEETIGSGLVSILSRMHSYIQVKNGTYFIPNPTDPSENFADRWAKYPERAQAFFNWLEKARQHFGEAARQIGQRELTESVGAAMGGSLAARAEMRNLSSTGRASLLRTATAAPSAAAGAFPNKPRVPSKPQGFA